MAEKIKNFFKRKKVDAKFKLAGPGHRLDSSSSSFETGKTKSNYIPPQRVEPTVATRQAAEAALARLNNQRKDTAFNTSLAAIQAQVRRELEAENKDGKNSDIPTYRKPIETELEASPLLAVKGTIRILDSTISRANSGHFKIAFRISSNFLLCVQCANRYINVLEFETLNAQHWHFRNTLE
ncbi:hypothetical protein AMK59_752 [Oryctes borbonicus]|uniref:Uncharacterized protein n=1 Tax=Oryctes borbonicus TaxID=1629725 RepID=A0A0T6BAT7_9SCAR|nr:hypothetical protein AMK59_752 [Oryctes borbonicus]